MNEKDGIEQLDQAKWELDEWNCLNLRVEDAEGRQVHAWLSERPLYCDRGHIQLNIDGHLDLNGADSFPRFFFSLSEAKQHTIAFLKWRIWKVRSYPPSEIMINSLWGKYGL